MILWGMGISQHVHGTDNARCLIALALMTGQIGRPGTGLHPLRGQNNVQGASDAGLIPMMFPDYQHVTHADARERFEQAWGVAPGSLDATPGLTVDRIDPRREVAAYAAEVLAAAKDLDDDGRALLAEDLRSPCTEEIAVFRALARVVAEGTDRVVVIDTAPTGHPALLLHAAPAYPRAVARTLLRAALRGARARAPLNPQETPG